MLLCASALGGAACGEPEEKVAPPIGHSGGSVTVGGASNATRTTNDDDGTGDDGPEPTESANDADGNFDEGATDASSADGGGTTTGFGTATATDGGTLDTTSGGATTLPGDTTFFTSITETDDATASG